MRKVTFGGANSLDNYFAGPDHEIDWLMWCDEAAEVMQDYWATIDTIVMGRKTFEVAMRTAGGGENHEGGGGGVGEGSEASAGGDSDEDWSGGMSPGMQTYVFSRTIPQDRLGGATIVHDDAADFVRELKGREGKDICVMGGGELARSLLEADLIDEVGFNIHPVLLGQGIPLFHPMPRRIELELKECRPFSNGCVYVLYGVKHRA